MLEASVAFRATLGPRNCEAGFEGRRSPLAVVPSSGAPVMPLAAAAMAATLLAAVELMLFLRVTRCAGFIEPTERECECGRDLGSEPAIMFPECRCWLAGRTAIGSWIAGAVSAVFAVQLAEQGGRALRTVMVPECQKKSWRLAVVCFGPPGFVSKAAAGGLHSLRRVGDSGGRGRCAADRVPSGDAGQRRERRPLNMYYYSLRCVRAEVWRAGRLRPKNS